MDMNILVPLVLVGLVVVFVVAYKKGKKDAGGGSDPLPTDPNDDMRG